MERPDGRSRTPYCSAELAGLNSCVKRVKSSGGSDMPEVEVVSELVRYRRVRSRF